MEKKQSTNDDHISPCVLIAVDGSRSSLRAADYVAGLTGLIPDLEIVVLYVLPQLPPIWRDDAETSAHAHLKLKEVERTNRRRGEDILKKAKTYLIEKGIPENRIRTKMNPRITGLVKDILSECDLGNYDALVIGRRGLSRAQELFMGSVSNQLVQHAVNQPLWVVDGESRNSKVLAAVDGSEASLRLVDHIGFMLGKNPEAEVHFLHVAPRLQTYCAIDPMDHDDHWDSEELSDIQEEFRRLDEQCQLDFDKRAVEILRRAGFSKDRILFFQEEVVAGIARTIIGKVKSGGYGTLAIGRRGQGKSSFLGSISDRVIRRGEDLAIWLVS